MNRENYRLINVGEEPLRVVQRAHQTALSAHGLQLDGQLCIRWLNALRLRLTSLRRFDSRLSHLGKRRQEGGYQRRRLLCSSLRGYAFLLPSSLGFRMGVSIGSREAALSQKGPDNYGLV